MFINAPASDRLSGIRPGLSIDSPSRRVIEKGQESNSREKVEPFLPEARCAASREREPDAPSTPEEIPLDETQFPMTSVWQPMVPILLRDFGSRCQRGQRYGWAGPRVVERAWRIST